MRRSRKSKVEKEKNTRKTVIIEDTSEVRNRPKKKVGKSRYWFSVFIGALVVVGILSFLTYKSLVDLFPWMFGKENSGTQVSKVYVDVKIPVWDQKTDTWVYKEHKIADAGEEFTISYVYSQFTASSGFTLGYPVKGRLRIVSVEKGDKYWNVFLAGSGIPFYSSARIRGLVCSALDDMEKNINASVKLYYDGRDIKDYIHCGKTDGYMVFYVRGNSVRARWIYDDSVNKADVAGYLMTVLKKASELGDTDIASMVKSVKYQNNTLTASVKEGAFVDASSYVKNALVYNMMYLYPYITNIEIDDAASLPYTDMRTDPIILVPTSGEDFLVTMGDRLEFAKQISHMFTDISTVKIGSGKAVVDFKNMPSREETEAIARSIISAKGVSSVVLTYKGDIPPFWADPFQEDF